MKKLNLFLMLMLVSLASMAKPWTAKTLPVPKNTTDSTLVTYVCNPDRILSTAEVDSLDQIMFSLEKTQGVRGLVICVAETDPDDPYDFCIEVGNTYGIGGKQNTGFILFVSTVSRGYYILTGDGMEKFLTDAQCSRISRNEMVPYFKEEQWGAGLLAGLRAVQSVCSGETELLAEDDEANDDEEGGNLLLWLGGGLAGLIGLGAYGARKARQCPQCKKTNYRKVLRQTVLVHDEEGALDDEEIEEQIQACLADLKAGRKVETKKFRTFNPAASAMVEGGDAATNQIGNSQDEANGLTSSDEASKAAQDKDMDKIMKSAGISMHSFENPKKHKYKKVRVIDINRCPDCGYEHRAESKGTTYDYMLGIFTSGTFGAVYHSSESSSSSSSRSHRSRSSSRSSGGHSWGSSGGGHFSGGGAGGRF
ncbi:MAG: TPM domain-containing protein [Bacteroidales bacterium]|nr:TPM domain-containing protein [Candidatus Physcousia equi]